MAIPSNILPSKCCCCSLRAGSIVVGSFSLIFSLVFLGLFATASIVIPVENCTYKSVNNENLDNTYKYEDNTYNEQYDSVQQLTPMKLYVTGRGKYDCVPLSEMYRTVANLMALLSILNAVEVVMSVGLIWGASKRILNWLIAYLVTTGCWIFLHSAIAIAYILATMVTAWIILISVVGLLVLGLALLSMLTVYGFCEELMGSLLVSSMQNPRTALSSEAAGNQSYFSGQP